MLVLDSLDQLSSHGSPSTLDWLIAPPPHTAIVLSTLETDEQGFLAALQARWPSLPTHPVQPFLAADASGALSALLARVNRTASARQMEVFAAAAALCPLPLYVSICAPRIAYGGVGVGVGVE